MGSIMITMDPRIALRPVNPNTIRVATAMIAVLIASVLSYFIFVEPYVV